MHTGNTAFQDYKTQRVSVHPRAYGEHPIVPVYGEWSFGSSPCIRGTRTAIDSVFHFSSVHPRAYGEHFGEAFFIRIFSGSSPCIRGTLSATKACDIWCRFIPVHTGNTDRLNSDPALLSVHPRAYGEHLILALAIYQLVGSSPCIRGTL